MYHLAGWGDFLPRSSFFATKTERALRAPKRGLQMQRRCVRNERGPIARRFAPAWLLALGLLIGPSARAQVDLGPVTVGAGLRTSYVDTLPDNGSSNSQFLLNDIRLYVSGTVYKDIKFMFNTDYNGATNSVNVLDAVARIEVNPHF